MGRTTIAFEYVSNVSSFEDLEYKIYEELQNKKKAICEDRNATIKDYYWSQYNIFDFDDHVTVVLSYRPRSDFDELTADVLTKDLSDQREVLKDLEEELEDIEDLDEDDYEEYDFESKEEYEKKLTQLEVDIFILKSDIELIERVLSERNNT